MAIWTVSGASKTKGHKYILTLDTQSKKWAVINPGDKLFTTRGGNFKFLDVSADEVVLYSASGSVVADFRALTETSPVGKKGTGYQQETAFALSWELVKKED